MFDFNQNLTSHERMEMLESFIRFWMSDLWSDDFGISDRELSKYKLPYPLKKFYSSAGKMPPANPEYDYTDSAFSIQDGLDKPEQLKYSNDGKVNFLCENQGNWITQTLCEGDDPPVWVSNDYSRLKAEYTDWQKCSESLSKFLVSYCLQELLCGAKSSLSNPDLDELFQTKPELFINILKNGDYVYGENTHNFYLLNENVLVSDLFGDSMVYASNSDKGIEFIKSFRGRIFEITIHFNFHQYRWNFQINADGSGEISFPNTAAANFPVNTFDFQQMLIRLQEIAEQKGSSKGFDDTLFFRRYGESLMKGINITSHSEVQNYFKFALKSISEKSENFDKTLNQYPILFK